MQPGIGARADGGHRLGLGEDLGVGTDADFEILAPGALLDQHRLSRAASGEPGLSLREIVADQRVDLGADLGGGGRIAARPLLDDALDHRDGEGDARRLDRLQVDRGKQPGFAGSRVSGAVLARMASSRRAPRRRRAAGGGGSAVSHRSRIVGKLR